MLIIGATRCVLLVLITVGCIYTCTPCPPHPDLHSWLKTNVCSYATATKVASSLHWQCFDPRDAITAQYQLWPVVCLSVCQPVMYLSVTCRTQSSIDTAGQIELRAGFGMEHLSTNPTVCVVRKFEYTSKIRAFPSGTSSELWSLD